MSNKKAVKKAAKFIQPDTDAQIIQHRLTRRAKAREFASTLTKMVKANNDLSQHMLNTAKELLNYADTI